MKIALSFISYLINKTSANNNILYNQIKGIGWIQYESVRKYEREIKKEVAAIEAIQFLKICLKNNIIPTFAKVKPHNRVFQQTQTYHNIQNNIVKWELQGKMRLYERLRNENTIEFEGIKELLKEHPKHYNQWLLILNGKINGLIWKIKSKHERKLRYHGIFQENSKVKNIYNFSSILLSKEQYDILSKGCNFISSKPKEKQEVLIEVEAFYKQIYQHEIRTTKIKNDQYAIKNALREITLKYTSNKNYRRNITKEERMQLEELRRNDKIRIIKADKVNSLVILDAKTYIRKGHDFLVEPQFSKSKVNSTIQQANDLLKFLERLKRKKLICTQEFDELKPLQYYSPYAYFLPKIHKPKSFTNLKMRPIVSCKNTPTYNGSQYLARILKSCLEKENAKRSLDSFQVIKELKEISFNNNMKFIGYDIENLYPSVPTDEAIELASKLLVKNKILLTNFEETIQLLEKYIKDIQFEFESDFYTQKDGLPMGSPLSPILAEIFLNNLENTKIFPKQNEMQILNYWRYVDDGLLITRKSTDENKLLQFLNGIHPKIKFTIEKEIQNQIHFLDINILRQKRYIETSVYRKPCHPQRFNNWESNIDRKYKLIAAKNLFDRANKICNNKNSKRKEFNTIKDYLLNSGYPLKEIRKCQKTIIEKQLTKSKPSIAEKKTMYFGTTYIGDETKNFLANINNVLKRHGPNSVDVRCYSRSKLPLQLTFRKKRCKPDAPHNSQCVYQIKCNECNESYIGETGRQVNVRIKEHKNYKLNQNSATINNHQRCFKHQADFVNVKILKEEKDIIKRKLWETYYIKNNPTFAGNKCSIEYDIFN